MYVHYTCTWPSSCKDIVYVMYHVCIPGTQVSKDVNGTCDEAVSIMPVQNLAFKSYSKENTTYTCAHKHDLFH